MKIINNMLGKKLLLLSLFLLSFTGFAQNFTVSLANPTAPTSNTLEFDVMLSVLAPVEGVQLSQVSVGINYNVALLNGGTPNTATGAGSLSFMAGTKDAALASLSPTTNTVRGPTAALPAQTYGQLRIVGTSLTYPNSPFVGLGTYRLGRYKFTNTTSWAAGEDATLSLLPTNAGGGTNTIVSWYIVGSGTGLLAYSTTNPVSPPGVALSHSLAAPLSFIPNNAPPVVCFSAGAQTASSAPTCAGDSNGSTTVTMSPVPSTLTATYVLDSGSVVPVTLSAAGEFTIPGLTAGAHTLTVTSTDAGCPAVVTVTGVSVPAGAPLTTNGGFTGSACDTYTWAGPLGNGQTYTSSVSGVTNTVGCNTATLNLTINASTSGTTTATACDTYTWMAPLGNGQTYTASNSTATFVSTNAAGCPNTQTLNLTINASSSHTTTISACDTYTWSAPLGNGTTYTSSVSGVTNSSTNAAGCPHVETLNLTINASTSGTTTATACDTYTWMAPLGNGQTYTASNSTATFVSTNAVGCPNTQTLNLTINNSTSGTTTATACDTYTWMAPLGNGQTYTASNSTATFVSTNAVGCPNTQTLNLTINASTSGTTTITACNTYTWMAPLGNGQTYTSSVSGVTNSSTNAAGCPHVETLNLTISTSTSGTTTATACDSYTWLGPLGNGQTYTASNNTATFVSTNGAGCTNTQTLNLTINASTSGTTTATACDTYTWMAPLGNGQTYTASNSTATFVSTNAAGCPNTQTLNLTINASSSHTTTISACDTYTWSAPLGNGTTYTSSVSGVTNSSTNAAGCPHVETLNLTINASTSGTTTATACDTYTWMAPLGNGQTYTASNSTATFVSTNAVGCPNTQTLNLTINASTLHTTTAVSCDSYVWAAPLGNGQTYTASNSTATNVTTNAAGCPHTEKLNLTINNSTTNGSISTSASGSYTWPAPLGTGLTYTVGGTYTNTTTNAAGCPNVATLNLTILTGTVNTFNIGTSCGSTITNLAVTITATPVSGATSYTFRLTNMATSTVQLITRPVNSFALSNYPGVTLGTQYQVEVSTNGGPFGPSCIVNTPAPVSNIGTQCGTVLTSMTQFVYATYVATATGYRFKITNTTTSAVQLFDSSLNRFFFNQLASRSFGTTYLVEVALRNSDGSYLPYNVGCNITTPAFPTTSLQASQCGYTAASNKENIYATVVSGATEYRFLLSRATAPTYSSSIDRALSSFNLSMFTGLTAGTVYSVQVAVKVDGVWGPYGSACNVTTPGAVRVVSVANAAFKAIAYPNPFASDFKFNVTTTAESTIQIRVYDMLGKQVENRNVEVSEIENLQVGADYPSGVYNVIVSQGESTQTMRVIKR